MCETGTTASSLTSRTGAVFLTKHVIFNATVWPKVAGRSPCQPPVTVTPLELCGRSLIFNFTGVLMLFFIEQKMQVLNWSAYTC